MYDICIIGAGVVGAAIARELSRYDLKICLIEKEEDVSLGASKANSGIVHGGYSAKHGTLKGELCAIGNEMYRQLEKELNFGFRETGALVIGFDEEDEKGIRELYENGIKIGCEDLEIIYGESIRAIEPHINKEVKVALYSKSVGVASPYELTIALVENAIENGVELKLESEVKAIEEKEDLFLIHTSKESIESRYVVNAAGLYSDKVSRMVGVDNFEIHPRRGQYILMGKDQASLVNTVIFQVPTPKGKGILVTTTYHGNFMIGPNAEEIGERDNFGTDIETLKSVVDTARKSIPNFNIKRALTTFSGIRAISNTGDFIIEETKVKRFINVAGIDSPGLTSSPAIAKRVTELIRGTGLQLVEKKDFNPYRRSIIIKKHNGFKGKVDDLDPNKNIICRCERVTEAEIIDAIHRGIAVKSTDAIKRRTRAGMGECQGNFCKRRVIELIARENNMSKEQVTERGINSISFGVRVDINTIRSLENHVKDNLE